MSEVKSLHWFDYVVFISTLVIAMGIGIYQACAGERQKSTSQYLSGNRNMKVLPVTISLYMSGVSAILILGNSAEAYLYGMQALLNGFFLAIFLAISGLLFCEMHHKLKIVSIFEYHRQRFQSNTVTYTCAIATIANMVLYAGLSIYTPSTALEAVTGFPTWVTVILLGVVTVIYTTIGGIEAVINTDFFQGFVMFGGVILVLIMGSIRAGGLSRIWEICGQEGRLEFFNMNPDPTVRVTFWTALMAGGLVTLPLGASDQNRVQRYCALPTANKAKISMAGQAPLHIVAYILVMLCGLVAFAYYHEIGCDPYRSGAISNSNQILPYFILDVVNVPGIPGIFIAALFAGALSSISTSLNGLAAVTWKEFLANRLSKLSEERKALVTKLLTLVYGVLSIIMAILFGNVSGHVMQISNSLIGGISAPIGGVIFIAALVPWVEWKGALTGIILGLGMVTWMNYGQNEFNPHIAHLYTNTDNCTFANGTTPAPIPEDPEGVFWLYRVSFHHISVVGLIVSIVFALVVSLITGKQDPSEVNPLLISPVVHKYCPCCLTTGKCCCGSDDAAAETEKVSEPKGQSMYHIQEDENISKDEENGIRQRGVYCVAYTPSTDHLDHKSKVDQLNCGVDNPSFKINE